MTVHNISTGLVQAGGQVSIKGGDTFLLAAPMNYGGTFNTGALKGSMKEWTAIVYTTGSSSTQNLSTGAWTDTSKTISLTAPFEVRTGEMNIIKTAEDGIVSGLRFRVTGDGIDQTVTTGDDETILVEDLMPGSYNVTEVSTPDKYAKPESQTLTIASGQTTTVSFSNILKKWNVTVTKKDAKKEIAQGDATLAGAVYGIYNGEELVDTYTTDANGQFTTSYYLCGDNWTIREITPSEGYLLNTQSYHIGAETTNYTVEYSSTANTVTEQVIKGNIAIIKHSDDGSTQIETPEEGAIFEVYLKSAGSYSNAKSTERDTLTCDENGFAQTKDLPYGVYTVHQVSGWEGLVLIADFDVYTNENGEVYRYLINNANFT